MTTMDQRPHALYRFWSAKQELLYVGITADLGARWKTHSKDKPWWADVASCTVEHHGSRDDVLAAERAAIVAEKPRHNVVHNSQVTRPIGTTKPEYLFKVESVVAVALRNRACPVGFVTQSRADGVRLDLFSWGTGAFGHDECWINALDVVGHLEARMMPYDEATRRGYLTPVYDMDPLADFQAEHCGPDLFRSAREKARLQEIAHLRAASTSTPSEGAR